MEMRITHADATRKELGFVTLYDKLDAQISIRPKASLVDNSFCLTLPDTAWLKEPIQRGHYLYIGGTEWGGPVEEIRHSTETGAVTLTGPTWRGMLMRKVIEPPTGEAYLNVTEEANALIRQVIGAAFDDLIAFDQDDTGVAVSGSWRYAQLHDGLTAALAEHGLTLSIQYDALIGSLRLGARPIVNHADRVDISQDYGIGISTEQGRMDAFNHVIALGRGELLEREVVHVYRLDSGTITTERPPWAGTLGDIATVYDYSSAEDTAELLSGASKRLEEYAPYEAIRLDAAGADIALALGDIVGARDRVTGLAAQAVVTEQILTISEDGMTIETRVG